MPDIFDTVSTGQKPEDIFDQVALTMQPQDIFDQVSLPPEPEEVAPPTPAALPYADEGVPSDVGMPQPTGLEQEVQLGSQQPLPPTSTQEQTPGISVKEMATNAFANFLLPQGWTKTPDDPLAGAAFGAGREFVKGATLGHLDIYDVLPDLKRVEEKYQQKNIPVNPKDPIFTKIGKAFQRDPAIMAKLPANVLGSLLTIGGISRNVALIKGLPVGIKALLSQSAITGGVVGALEKTDAPALSAEGLGERVKNVATMSAIFTGTTAVASGLYRIFKGKTILTERLKEEAYKLLLDKKGIPRTQQTVGMVNDGLESMGNVSKLTRSQIKTATNRIRKAAMETMAAEDAAFKVKPASLALEGQVAAEDAAFESRLTRLGQSGEAAIQKATTVPPRDLLAKADAIGARAGRLLVGAEGTPYKALAKADLKRVAAEEDKLAKAVPAPAEITPKPPLTGEGSTPPGKPPDEPISSEVINQDYESLKDSWFAEKDQQTHIASVESARLQNQIKTTTNEPSFRARSKQIDKAIQVHIDLKRNPGHLEKYWSKLTPQQRQTVKMSQNLNPGQLAIADEIATQYQRLGIEALDAEVIRNTIDNYAARIWDVKQPKTTGEQFRKFGATTRHAKARKFETILEGWANGFNLKVEGATSNLSIIKEEIHNTIQDKKFVQQLTKLKDLDGNPVMSTKQLEGYVRVEHPNFKAWRFAGQAEPADLRGRNFLQTPEGTVLERKELYAPKEIAHNLNNIMGVSKLKGKRAWDAATKYNAVTKAWILQSSFFHHLAFMRSYYLGSAPVGEAVSKLRSGEGFMDAIKELTPRQSYLSGQKSIMDMTPEIELLVRNGLTLGKVQDWEESIIRHEDTFVGRMMDKYKAPKEVKDAINTFRQNQADFLFKQFGAGLKAKAALIELKSILKKNPNIDPNKAAKIAANLMNNDFGGLHLKRIGRDPTTQHLFRLFALAPDWTESNIRSMVKAFKTGTEGEVYRRFWARIIAKSMFATLAAGALLHGKELPERYIQAWKGQRSKDWRNLKWMDVDITPIYKAFGGDTDARKYFSLIGHFKDPLKFALHPLKSAEYKGSVVYRAIEQLRTGEDWAGREFTELPELLATGATVRPYATFAPRPGEYSRLPSYLLSQLKGTQPIQVQQLLNWWAGETEGFDAIGKAMGFDVGTTYPPSPEKKAKEKEIRRTIKRLHPKGRK